MGKSIRSKVKRAHRRTFRAGEGQVFADASMAKIQANLKKNMKSDEELDKNAKHLQNLFGGDEDEHDENDMADKEDSTIKKTTFVQKKKSTKHATKVMADTTAAAQARRKLSKSNKRGTTKFGFSTQSKKTATKKRGTKMAQF
ncbi:hypothetical protein ScalyP_jg3134 [Parmales sp. scaly parma]|jgi:hypothetical protein|nr:hypothetical protein ScalyP_jg3134 [Parmales sp. scaly parma]